MIASIRLNNKKHSIADKLMGNDEEFSMDNRMFNLGCIITFISLLFFLTANLASGLWPSFWLTIILIFCQASIYYNARFRKKFRVSIIVSAAIGYAAIVANFYINSGISGPTIFLFLFTFNLLMASTPNGMHVYWLVLHLLLGCLMIIAGLAYPGFIKNTYNNPQARFVDVLVTCIITLLFSYIITRYLRNHYLHEKLKARESQIRLKAFFESTENCYILLNSKSEIIYFNSASARFTRMVNNRDLHEGDNMETFVSYAYIHRFRENYHNALNGTRCTEEKLLLYHGIGKIWWQFSFAPVFNSDGSIAGVSFTSVNITSRKEHAEKIKQRNQSLTQIAFLQSHELRQPVSSILGLLNLIREDGGQIDEYLVYLADAVNELDTKLDAIVAQTKDASGRN